MAKKKTTRGRKTASSNYAKIAFIVVLCFLSGAFTYGVLDLIFSKKQNFAEISLPAPKKENEKVQNSPNLKPQNPPQQQVVVEEKPKQENKSEENLTFISLPQNLQDNNQSVEAAIKNEELIVKKPFDGKKPKLAIIMDDISEAGQVAKIKKLPVSVTPSIFPPSAKMPNTPNLAKGFRSFLIHLPLEALNYADNLKTIKTNASYEEIEQAVAKLRKDFPNAKFINNHTGSKFTGDKNAVNSLLRALYMYDFSFVDSRTIGKTAVGEVIKNYRMRYAYRDIFLDNIDSVAEVRAKLQEAVQIAKKKGYAIAIGHPKNATFSALANSSDILSQVEVVYFDEIYGYYK